MEGIMTGIKPRKMFSTAGLSKADQNIVGDVRRKMNLIDFVSGGGSGLSDPLTQFLLTAGPDLVAGKAAGGSKIQEILGGVKPGIDRAIKTQQLKDLSDRKLATQLIAKSGTGDFSKAFRSYGQYMTNPDTGKKYTEEEFRPVFGKIQLLLPLSDSAKFYGATPTKIGGDHFCRINMEKINNVSIKCVKCGMIYKKMSKSIKNHIIEVHKINV